MAVKKIIWSSKAKEELNNIFLFYNQRNKSKTYSLKLLAKITDFVKTISKNQFIGRLTNDNTIRVVPFGAYLIFYQINSQNIEIISFWDNRQDDDKRIL